MIKIIIITHGQLGHELLKTAEAIVGKQEDTIVVPLAPQEGLTSLCQRTGEILESVDSRAGALILTDMLGGTPCNACLPYCNTNNIEIVSGVNLYMMLSSFINRTNLDLKKLADKVIEDGRKSITNAKDMLLNKLR
jgi:PTS system mannose-specific IIA component